MTMEKIHQFDRWLIQTSTDVSEWTEKKSRKFIYFFVIKIHIENPKKQEIFQEKKNKKIVENNLVNLIYFQCYKMKGNEWIFELNR